MNLINSLKSTFGSEPERLTDVEFAFKNNVIELINKLRTLMPCRAEKIPPVWFLSKENVWYRVSFLVEFEDELRITLNQHAIHLWPNKNKLFVTFDKEEELNLAKEGENSAIRDIYNLVNFVIDTSLYEVNALIDNPQAYYSTKNVPVEYMYHSMDYFEYLSRVGDKHRLEIRDFVYENLSIAHKFLNIALPLANQIKPVVLTQGKYLEAVKVAYAACNDLDGLPYEAEELYKLFSSNEPAGLMELDPDSENAFYEWFDWLNKYQGKPFDIIEGGKQLNIKLIPRRANVPQNDTSVFRLQLDGDFRTGFATDIMKIFVALYEAGIPVFMKNHQALIKMLSGTASVALLPDYDQASKYTDRPNESMSEVILSLNRYEVDFKKTPEYLFNSFDLAAV